MTNFLRNAFTSTRIHRDTWFPGRWIGGGSLIAGPVLWFAGWALRYLPTQQGLFDERELARFAAEEFAGPMELAMFQRSPALVTAGYACFFAGAVLLWPAVAALARIVAMRSPALAHWGGALLITGLFARAYFAGVDQTAFQLTGELGLETATDAIMGSYADIVYGPWRLPVWCSVGQYAGTLLLTVGAVRARVFGVGRAVVFVVCGMAWTGVLKGVGQRELPGFPFEFGLLCLVLVPLGIAVLRGRLPERLTPSTQVAPGRLRVW